VEDVEPESTAPPEPVSAYDRIDPYAQAPMPRVVSRAPATTGARVMSVVLDFVFLNILTTLVVVVIASVASVVLLGGANGEQTAKAYTYISLLLSAMASAWYFLSSPLRRRGQTIGQRLLGVGPRARDGSPASTRSVARHHFVVFFVPSLLLDPAIVIGIRDLAVLTAWCLLQFAYNHDGQTVFENAAGISVVSGLP
jgi:uncharacterized RDD family membrane protein YckC